jgi:hypothetical protein
MKRAQNPGIFVLLLAVLSFSNCLHFIEEITINKNGGGAYSLTIDGREIKRSFNSMGELVGDKFKQKGVSDSTIAELKSRDTTQQNDGVRAKAIEHLRLQNGIRKVENVEDSLQFLSGYRFEFDDLTSLKNAMSSGATESSMGFWNVGSDVRLDKKTFYRKAASKSIRDLMLESLLKKGADQGKPVNNGEFMLRKLFGSLTYKQVYHFPDRKVKGCNNPDATISSDKHTVTILTRPFQLDEKSAAKTPAELKIRLK